MMILPQYGYETRLYKLVPLHARWIFNKLMVAERLGLFCGPCGVPIWKKGTYCVRPVMSLTGCGRGGWEKFECDGTRYSAPEYRPGWFWMPWYEGRHIWTEYVDDVPLRQAGGFMKGNILKWEQSYDFIDLPDVLKGFSKYMVVESIGGNIVEVAPKHLADNKEHLMDMQLVKDENGNNLWEELWDTTRPWI